MNFDLSQPGLYYLLNTPEIKAELARLKLEAKASFEKNPDAETIAQMMARAISAEVEKYIADKRAEASAVKNNPEDWVYEALKDLPDVAELKEAIKRTLPAQVPVDNQVLTEIKTLPDAVSLRVNVPS